MTLSKYDITNGKIENTDGNKYGKPLGMAQASCQALEKTNCFVSAQAVTAAPQVVALPNDAPAVPVVENTPVAPVAVAPTLVSPVPVAAETVVPVAPVVPEAPRVVSEPAVSPTVTPEISPINMTPEEPVVKAQEEGPVLAPLAGSLPSELPVAPVTGNTIDSMAAFTPVAPSVAPTPVAEPIVEAVVPQAAPVEPVAPEVAAIEPVNGEVNENLFDLNPVPAQTTETPIESNNRINEIFEQLSVEINNLIEEAKRNINLELSLMAEKDNKAVSNALNEGISQIVNEGVQMPQAIEPAVAPMQTTEIPQMPEVPPLSM